MKGLTIIETETMDMLIASIKDLKQFVTEISEELTDSKSPYLDTKGVIELTGFKKTWVNAHKVDLGGRIVGGELRFKRKLVEEYMDQPNSMITKRK